MHYKQLNYDTYDEYLNGVEWQQIRDWFYHESGVPYRCSTCFARSKLLVHKRSYAYLTVPFFRKNKRLARKILTYKCFRCNDLIHFYDRKKTQKVPLCYLFLTLHERRIYWRLDMVIRRTVRGSWYVAQWFWYSYWPYATKARRL